MANGDAGANPNISGQRQENTVNGCECQSNLDFVDQI